MFLSRKRLFLLSVFMFIFLLGYAQIVSGASKPKKLVNIILISIDTLRSDHLGCYGNSSIKTPNIDRLAQEGILFKNAYSPTPLTLPSHASILTGLYPSQHGVHNNGSFALGDSAKTLSEILQDFGYKTGAVVASFVLASHFGLDQGFDEYDDFFYQNNEKMPNDIQNSRIGKDVTDIAEKWLQKNHKKPFFFWVHFFDPHYPYEPPSPFDELYKDMPYDGEIAYTDQCLGDFFKEIRRLSLLENTCIIVVGDHGEGLGEHNEQRHGLFIYDSTLRVPLIISYPKVFQKGNKVASLVRTIDIMPTILEISGINTKDIDIQGTSLVPFLKGNDNDIKLDLYCESRYPELNFDWAPLEGIVTYEGWKYIYAPRPELYSLLNDPLEKSNLFSTDTKKAKAMEDRLTALKKGLSVKSQSKEGAVQVVLSPGARERLLSLGYIGYSGPDNEEKDSQSFHSLPDPKDKTSVVTEIENARDLEQKGEFDQAVKRYENVLKQDTDNKAALYCLGLAYMNTGRPMEGLNMIQKLAKIDSQNIECQFALGHLYDILAMPDEAIQAYKKALQLNPKIAHIHNDLGMVYLKTEALDLAIQEFQSVISLSQDPILTSIALGNIGGIYARQEYLEGAVIKFKESISFNSLNKDARISLAETYCHLEELGQAIEEWKTIISIWPDDYIAYYRLAQLYIDDHNAEMAIMYLRKSLQIRPDYIDARILLDQIYQASALNRSIEGKEGTLVKY